MKLLAKQMFRKAHKCYIQFQPENCMRKMLEELFWHCSCMRCVMVGLRWGTEERAADQGGGGSTFLLYLRLLLNLPSYIHTPTLAYLHTFFFDYLTTYPTTLFWTWYVFALFIS